MCTHVDRCIYTCVIPCASCLPAGSAVCARVSFMWGSAACRRAYLFCLGGGLPACFAFVVLVCHGIYIDSCRRSTCTLYCNIMLYIRPPFAVECAVVLHCFWLASLPLLCYPAIAVLCVAIVRPHCHCYATLLLLWCVASVVLCCRCCAMLPLLCCPAAVRLLWLLPCCSLSL